MFDVLYHWSPSERREEILRKGLRVYSNATVTRGNYKWPYICLSTRPSIAWGLSGDFLTEPNGDPIEEWDLWEVRIPEMAEVHVRPFWGIKIEEIKVYTSIPADHVWLVGQRILPSAIEVIAKRNGKKKEKVNV